jgi:hypothetical protein
VRSTELRRELDPATVEVGRVGRPVLNAGTLGWAQDAPDDRQADRKLRARRRRILTAALVVAAATAGLIAAALVAGSPSERRAQSDTGRAAPRPVSTAAAAATAAATATRQQPSTKAATTATTTRRARTQTTGRLAPAVSQPARQATTTTAAAAGKSPLPNSGYVSGGSHLLVDRSGQMIVNFVVAQGCVRGLLLPTIPIQENGTFRYKGLVRATPVTRATITGRFVDREHVRVRMRFVSPRCESAKALTMRLS